MNRIIASREYKLMLNPLCFTRPRRGFTAFRALLEVHLRRVGANPTKPVDADFKRLTWYLDTPGLTLYRRHFILRIRGQQAEDEPKRTEYKVTLKFRHPDRYIAAGANLSCLMKSKRDRVGEKFEEDIVPPFRSEFSHSVSYMTGDRPRFRNIADVVEVFPGLVALDLPAEMPIRRVGGQRFYESCHWLGKYRFDHPERIRAALTYWHTARGRRGIPAVAEFSFDYDLPNKPRAGNGMESYPEPLLLGAERLFRSLQREPAWLDGQNSTKTGYAYAQAAI